MSELKACPLCRSDADKRGGLVRCSHSNCPMYDCWMPPSVWQSRPLEDALLKRAEAAEKELGNVMGTIQRHQPGGSPPPGGSMALTDWVLSSLSARIAELEAASEWIPVTERLPEKSYEDLGDEKLVELGYPYECVATMKFRRDVYNKTNRAHWFTGYGINYTEWTQYVIRWRDLPQPTKPEEE